MESSAEKTNMQPPSRWLDLLANLVLGSLYAFLCYRSFVAWDYGHGQWPMLILAVQEGLVVLLAVVRRQTRDVSRSPQEWIVAVGISTGAPLVVGQGVPVLGLKTVALVIQLVGLALSLFAVGSLGRSFGMVPANRGIQTDGLYRFIRHPLYATYFVAYIGFILGSFSFWNFGWLFASQGCQIWRALAEEKLLSRDPEYAAYLAKVRWRFIPFLF